jgi:hypothetical protein
LDKAPLVGTSGIQTGAKIPQLTYELADSGKNTVSKRAMRTSVAWAPSKQTDALFILQRPHFFF